MRKNTKIAVVSVVALACIIGATAIFTTRSGKEVNTTPAPEPTITTTTLAPTSTPEPTTVVATSTPEPTMVVATSTPEPTATPTPSPSPLPTNTPTPLPTSTPVPTTSIAKEEDLIVEVQMGDNVWYKFYNGGILVVSGTGSTWDFETGRASSRLREVYEDAKQAKQIVIEEGITRIGDNALSSYDYAEEVCLPNSLQELGEYAFKYTGLSTEQVTWINLDLSKIKAENNSFTKAYGLSNIEGSSAVMCTPTPTPTPLPPTPTPTPNPENPRLCFSFEAGANATLEIWDNGYLYIKGTGKVDDLDSNFVWDYYLAELISGERYSYDSIGAKQAKEFMDTFKYLIIDEGITYLGINFAPSVYEVWLPKSLTTINTNCDTAPLAQIIHWYYDDKPVTLRSADKYGVSFLDVPRSLEDKAFAEKEEVIVTFE